jgi:virginiamycin B lyase
MMRTRWTYSNAVVLAALLLAGCGGGGSQRAALPGPIPSPKVQTQSVTFVVQLPSRTASKTRGTRYVSAATQLIQASVTPVGGGTATTAQNACANGQCSVTIAAPVGADAFTIGLYDAQNKLLSSGSTSQTIVEGQSNTVNVVFGGVIASVAVQPLSATFVRGTPASTTVAINALDADGFVIVGPPANYSSPIAVSTNDTSGAVTLSAATVTQPGTTITLTYNGSASVPASVTITATTTGAPAATAPIMFAVPAYLYENDVSLTRYSVGGGAIASPVSIATSCNSSKGPRMVAVSPVNGTAYAEFFDCPGPNAHGVTVARGAGSLGPPFTLADGYGFASADGAGSLYVSTGFGASVYAPPLVNGAQPIRRLSAPLTGEIALDSHGALYAVVASGNSPTTKINVYAPNAIGVAVPIRVLQPPAGAQFYHLAIDRSDNLYVDGFLTTAPAVFVYPPGASGSAAPSRVITGPATNLFADTTIAADASGYAYVAGQNAILVFAPTANGNAAPAATAPAGNTPGGLAVDNIGLAPPAPPSGNPAPAVHVVAAATLPNIFAGGMTAGPDSALWLAENQGHVYRVGATNDPGGLGNLTTYAVPGDPTDITTGSDGALWIVERVANAILRLTTGGASTQYPLPVPNQDAVTIGRGGDGNVWFFTRDNPKPQHVGRITPAGTIAEFALPANDTAGANIIPAPDGNTYSVLGSSTGGGDLARIAPDGTVTVIATLPAAGPICIGSDGNFWVAMAQIVQLGYTMNDVARIPLAGGSPAIFPVYLPAKPAAAHGIATGPLGNVYVGLAGIEAVSTTGVEQFDVVSTADDASGPSHPNVVLGPDGRIWYYQLSVTGVSTSVTVLAP